MKNSTVKNNHNKNVELAAEQLARLFIEQIRDSRQKKKLTPSPLRSYIEQIKLNLSYQWEPILIKEDQEYHYPMRISSFMNKQYKYSAIYRWDIYKQLPEDQKQIYIGEAQILCPQRIQGYLTPGPSQQTNKRLKVVFQTLIKEGFKIRLEVLKLQRSTIGRIPLIQANLSSKHVRQLIERLLIVNYMNKGYKLLNL